MSYAEEDYIEEVDEAGEEPAFKEYATCQRVGCGKPVDPRNKKYCSATCAPYALMHGQRLLSKEGRPVVYGTAARGGTSHQSSTEGKERSIVRTARGASVQKEQEPSGRSYPRTSGKPDSQEEWRKRVRTPSPSERDIVTGIEETQSVSVQRLTSDELSETLLLPSPSQQGSSDREELVLQNSLNESIAQLRSMTTHFAVRAKNLDNHMDAAVAIKAAQQLAQTIRVKMEVRRMQVEMIEGKTK